MGDRRKFSPFWISFKVRKICYLSGCLDEEGDRRKVQLQLVFSNCVPCQAWDCAVVILPFPFTGEEMKLREGCDLALAPIVCASICVGIRTPVPEFQAMLLYHVDLPTFFSSEGLEFSSL